MATRTGLAEVVGQRYRSVDRSSKGRVLDEFAAVTGFHRKHAMRLRRVTPLAKARSVCPERRVYDEAVRTALIVLWEAADRMCGKRLRPLIPILLAAMERHGHLDLAPDVKSKLMEIGTAPLRLRLRSVAPINQKVDQVDWSA